MLREPMSVSGGSRYIPPQVGSHISISSTMAITRANTSLGQSDMCRRLSLVTGNLRTRQGCARGTARGGSQSSHRLGFLQPGESLVEPLRLHQVDSDVVIRRAELRVD